MPDVPFAYGYENQVRDVSEALLTVNKSMPRLIQLVSMASERAMNHKHEWTEDSVEPTATSVTAAKNDVITVLPFASVTGVKANDIWRVDGTNEVLRVTDVNTGTKDVTVVRGYGGSTKAAIPKDTAVLLVSRPKLESTRAALEGDPKQPTLNYNYTEIFDAEASVPLSMVPVYGIRNPSSKDPVGDAMNYQVNLKLIEISRNMNSAMIYGRRVARGANNSTPGTMGGILQFHEGGASVNGGGAQISRKLLGDAFAAAFTAGAVKLGVVLCNVAQARNISRLYESQLRVTTELQTAGHRIIAVQPDMPIEGYVSRIVVDPNFPSNMLSIFDAGNIKLVPFRAFTDKKSSTDGDDFLARRIIGEYTAEFKNWQDTAVQVTNLSTTLIPDAA